MFKQSEKKRKIQNWDKTKKKYSFTTFDEGLGISKYSTRQPANVSLLCSQTLAYSSSKWNVHHRNLNADKITPEEIKQIQAHADEIRNEKLKDVVQWEHIMWGLLILSWSQFTNESVA